MQVIVMTSDNQYHCLPAYCHLFEKYYGMSKVNTVMCGFSSLPQKLQYPEYTFYSVGDFTDYPPQKWSDALLKVLDEVAEEVFLLMLSDYWLTRPVDTKALEMMYHYMFQFENVIKFDVAYDRLGAWGANLHYNTLGHLDLVKSNHASQYHMSLWGGLWRRDLMKKIIIPGETAQQIELNGTHRLAEYGDEILVLGTRQAPMLHANVIQNGVWNQDARVGIPALKESDRLELKELRVL